MEICQDKFNCVIDVRSLVEAAINVVGANRKYKSVIEDCEKKVRTTHYILKGEDDQYLDDIMEDQRKLRDSFGVLAGSEAKFNQERGRLPKG